MTPSPRHPLDLATVARMRRLAAGGDAAAARGEALAALAMEPNLPGVHDALARLRWPGPDFRFWLGWLHATLRPAVYLELGVEHGHSLALAQPPTLAIGVDPSPGADVLARCAPGAQLHRMTSSEFLARPPAQTGLADRGFDLAFVDGDHRFAGVLDDFIGLEALAAPGAVIAVHDTLPLDALTAGPDRRTGFYSGDGWKLGPCLCALRPALRVVTLPVAPTGLTLITGLEPASRVLADRRNALVEAYGRLDAAHAAERPATALRLGRNDAQWVSRWLAAR
jgi:hypothetical protein